MTVTVKNRTEYDSRVVRRLVRATLRDLDADDVGVTVSYRRATYGARVVHAAGSYREWWYSGKEDRPQIVVTLPRPGVAVADYVPYQRRHSPPTFELRDWREALVALVAHEGTHHRQTPRNYYRSSRQQPGGRHRYREVECDWAAYRAVLRFRGEL